MGTRARTSVLVALSTVLVGAAALFAAGVSGASGPACVPGVGEQLQTVFDSNPGTQANAVRAGDVLENLVTVTVQASGCALSGATVKVTTPDGVLHTVAAGVSVAPGGSVTFDTDNNVGGDTAVASPFSYTVADANIGSVNGDPFATVNPLPGGNIDTWSSVAGTSTLTGGGTQGSSAFQNFYSAVLHPETSLTKTPHPASGMAPLSVTFSFDDQNVSPDPANLGAQDAVVGSSMTMADSNSNCTPVQVLSGGHNTGDTNANGLLDVGETWHWTCQVVFGSVGGPFSDTATATGNAGDGREAGTAASDGMPHDETASATVSVAKNTPTLSTTPQPGTVAVGSVLNDKATIANLASPVTSGAGAGTVTMSLFSPADPSCSGTPDYALTVTASSGNGGYLTSPGFTAGVAGTWHWSAVYSGDANNNAVTSACTAEPVNVTRVTPTVATTPQPASGQVGQMLNDQATLSNLVNPVTSGAGAGTITFQLFSSTDASCTGTPAYSQTVTASAGNATYTTSPGFSSNLVGVWHWAAAYSGDVNNTAQSSACSSEPVTITQATPALATAPQPATTTIGSTLNDKGTMTKLMSPVTSGSGAGSILFELFSPSDPACTGTPAYSQTITVAAGNGSYLTTPGFVANVAGTWHWTAAYSGDVNNTAVASSCSAEPVTVNKITPTLTTAPQPASGPVGTLLNDQAAMSGLLNPVTSGVGAGTITFKLFWSADPTCAGSPLYTQTVDVSSGNATYLTSPGYTSVLAGTWHWTAAYSGDANNNAVTSACSTEPVSVSRVTPTLTTAPQPASGPMGTVLDDQGTISGLVNPVLSGRFAGTITFKLFPPADTTCSSTPSYIQTVVVASGNGSYVTSPGFTSNLAGTWHWTAAYAGDLNNNKATSACTAEPVAIGKSVTPTLLTAPQPASGAVGASLNDQGTVSGLVSPVTSGTGAGTVTFNLFSPGDPTCSGTPAYTQTVVAASGNGTYGTTPGFTSNLAGTWHWSASYSGDANNAQAQSACSSEPVTVSDATPTLTTAPQPASGPVGTMLNDQGTISGLVSPVTSGTGTGKVTFNLFSPADPSCSGSPAFTQAVVLSSGNGTYATSGGFQANAPGTWHWTAVYSGDVNNNVIASACSSEAVTIGKPTPRLATTPAPATGSVGSVLNDQATISGLVAPVTSGPGTGTITFSLYSPADPNCSGTPAYRQTVPVTGGNGSYATSPGKAAATAGVWNWTAAYSGDANNMQAASGCGMEPVTVALHGAFVVGDISAGGPGVGTSVTFWSSQWAKTNHLSGGRAPAAMKGFADFPTSLTCGASFTTRPGSSAHPPAVIPSQIEVIVSSHVVQSAGVISGDIEHLVMVQVNTGYWPAPGHVGTGTIISTIC